MEILEVDMQMVRDFLNQADAPEYIKGHFENLIAEYEEADKARDEMKSLESELDDAKAEVDELKGTIAGLEEELDERFDERYQALETVKYAFLDTMVHGRPMILPRHLLRIVEEALL